MKKVLITLAAIGAIWTPSVVCAQGTGITIFGRVQAEYSGVNVGGLDDNGAPLQYQGGIGDNSGSSRWGLQMTENLGRGLKVIARLEEGMNTGSGRSSNPREQWVGLSGSQWGEVKFGRVQSPFKDFAGGMTIDPFAYTALQANGAGGTMSGNRNGLGSGANSFVESAIRFDTATFRGFSFSALLLPDYALNAKVDMFGEGESRKFDAQVAAKYVITYQDHTISLFGGYSRDQPTNFDKVYFNYKTEETWRVGSTWKYENFGVVGQYERVTNAIDASNCTSASALDPNPLSFSNGRTDRGQCTSSMNSRGDGDIWHIGSTYQWGSTQLVAQGGMKHAEASTLYSAGLPFVILDSRDSRSFTAGLIHTLSRRTSLYGGFQRVAFDAHTGPDIFLARIGLNRDTWTVGIRHNF